MKPEDRIHDINDMFNGICDVTYFKSGAVNSIRLNQENMIITHAGQLIPFSGEETPRRKYKASVTFFEDGALKSVSLNAQQEVMTPIGEMPAELVTFYDTGELKRIFPLDGKISGFWSEEDERALNIPFNFEFDFTAFSAMLTGICFYKTGEIRSITLYPKELIKITHPSAGTLSVRQGFSLYESGNLHSFEPAAPVKLQTPIGLITAFDPNANGVNADLNSICLDEQGNIQSLVTAADRIHVSRKSDGVSSTFQPKMLYAADEPAELVTLTVKFNHESKTVTIIDTDVTPHCYSFDDNYIIYNNAFSPTGCSSGDCSSCSLCDK